MYLQATPLKPVGKAIFVAAGISPMFQFIVKLKCQIGWVHTYGERGYNLKKIKEKKNMQGPNSIYLYLGSIFECVAGYNLESS